MNELEKENVLYTLENIKEYIYTWKNLLIDKNILINRIEYCKNILKK